MEKYCHRNIYTVGQIDNNLKTRLMKIFLSIIFLLLLNCSFDNKTGIWKNNNQIDVNKKDRFEDFEKLYTSEKSFDSIIAPDNNLKISIDPIRSNLKWLDEYYQDSNNLDNFSYKNLNQLIFKSKRLSRHKINSKLFCKRNCKKISLILNLEIN